VGVIAAAREKWSLAYLRGAGVAYLVVAAYGIVIHQDRRRPGAPVGRGEQRVRGRGWSGFGRPAVTGPQVKPLAAPAAPAAP
jgi:hypothetical protein